MKTLSDARAECKPISPQNGCFLDGYSGETIIRYRNVRGGRRCDQDTPQGSSIVTIAGTSAGAEARRLRGRADEHRRQADEAEQRAGRYEIAERTEAETARVLAPLAGIGYHLLADRRWPGSKHAQVDMIVVGSAGVFIIDTKSRSTAIGSTTGRRTSPTTSLASRTSCTERREPSPRSTSRRAKSTRSSHSPLSAGCTRTSPRSTSSGFTTSSVTSRSGTRGCQPSGSTRCSPL